MNLSKGFLRMLMYSGFGAPNLQYQTVSGLFLTDIFLYNKHTL